MPVQFVLCMNTNAEIRTEKWYSQTSMSERGPIIGNVYKTVISHVQKERTSVIPFEFKYKLVFKQYDSLFVIIGILENDNELLYLECIKVFMNVMNLHFNSVCERDFVDNPMIAYRILDVMFYKNEVIELNSKVISTRLEN